MKSDKSYIAKNLSKIKNEIERVNQNIKLVAVSKTFSDMDVIEAYNTNQKIFGENWVQEGVKKILSVNKSDIEWHFIGRLQSNKIKDIVTNFNWIQTVDNLKKLDLISKYAFNINKDISYLVQINISNEEQKNGVGIDRFEDFIKEALLVTKNINLKGIMCIGSFTDDIKIKESEFKKMKEISNILVKYKSDAKEISMGMSSDYLLAIRYGATIVRVGSLIFGNRAYNKKKS